MMHGGYIVTRNAKETKHTFMKAYFIYNTQKKIQTTKFIVGFIGADVPKKSQQPLNQYNYKTP